MEYDNTNRGAIWPNDRKEKDEQPDFTGTLNVDGKEYWVSAWRNGNKSENAPVLQISVTKKLAKPGTKTKRSQSL